MMADIPYGKRLLPQVVDEAAEQEPSRVVGMIAKSTDISKGFREISIGELATAVNHVAHWIEEKIGKSNAFETIAYIGIGDFRYWIMELAAMKCGYVILLPSARNSDANNVSLFGETRCTKLFYTQPFGARLAGLSAIGVEGYLVPSFEDMVTAHTLPYPYTKTWEDARSDAIAILHTSGSTGAPKPIKYNHAFIGLVDASRTLPGAYGRPDGNISLLDGSVHFFAFPAFHLAGFCYGTCSLFYRSVQILPPPEMPPNGKTAIDIMGEHELTQLICPPTLFDDLVKNYRQELVDRGRSLTHVHNAGGPLAQATGDFLSTKVAIVQIIGSSETGKLPCLVSEREDWAWYEWNPHVGGAFMERIDEDSDIYELTVQRVPGQEWAQGVFHVFPETDVYRTRDLFRKHPTKQLWSFDGRKDDVIVLNNGEKFNPVAMEGSLSGHPLVKGALVVGSSYDQVGLILETDEQGDDFVEKVWPAVRKANEEAPKHARLYKHMV